MTSSKFFYRERIPDEKKAGKLMAENAAVPPSASISQGMASTSSNLPPNKSKTTEVKSPQQKSQPAAETPPKDPRDAFKGTKHKTIVDGAEMEVSYEDLVESYQKGQSADKRFKEAAKLEKAVNDTLQGLATGDDKTWAWLKKTVPKDVFKKVAFDYAYTEMEYDALPPEKKREMELNDRERKLQEEETRREEAQKQQVWQSEVNQAGELISKQLDEFVERSGKRPSSEELYRMTEYMLAHIHKHNSLPSVDQIYQRAERQLEMDAHSVLKKRATDPKSLAAWLPPDVVKALKRAFLDEATQGQPKRYQPEGSEASSGSRRGGPKKVGIDEAFSLLEKRIKRSR